MGISAGPRISPQARGRELAREGTQLCGELGSVKHAARELMNRHRDLPSVQAFRYAAGLSQDQAAARYKAITDHHTSLGGTTINAWETWARGRGAGSPPPVSSLLILAAAYGRGPTGISEEKISPTDLAAEAYERLAPEDQLSLKAFTGADNILRPDHAEPPPGSAAVTPASIGPDFNLPVPTVDHGNPEVCAFTLPNPRPGQLLDLSWEVFGFGIERLIRQIKNQGREVRNRGPVSRPSLSDHVFGWACLGQ